MEPVLTTGDGRALRAQPRLDFVTRLGNAVRWWFGGTQPAPPDRPTPAESPAHR